MYTLLCNHDANPKIKNEKGLTPLTLAAQEGSKLMFDVVLRQQRTVCMSLGHSSRFFLLPTEYNSHH